MSPRPLLSRGGRLTSVEAEERRLLLLFLLLLLLLWLQQPLNIPPPTLLRMRNGPSAPPPPYSLFSTQEQAGQSDGGRGRGGGSIHLDYTTLALTEARSGGRKPPSLPFTNFPPSFSPPKRHQSYARRFRPAFGPQNAAAFLVKFPFPRTVPPSAPPLLYFPLACPLLAFHRETKKEPSSSSSSDRNTEKVEEEEKPPPLLRIGIDV